MANLNTAARNTIRRRAWKAGYAENSIADGIAYAESKGATTALEGFILTISYIFYDADALARGARFSVERGQGPRA